MNGLVIYDAFPRWDYIMRMDRITPTPTVMVDIDTLRSSAKQESRAQDTTNTNNENTQSHDLVNRHSSVPTSYSGSTPPVHPSRSRSKCQRQRRGGRGHASPRVYHNDNSSETQKAKILRP